MKNKFFLAILLLLNSLYSWSYIDGDYYSANISDTEVPTREYTLTLKALPSDGGSFNTTSTNIEGGKTYNLWAYPSSDFVFVAWVCDGDTLSKSSTYTYTMPYHDVEIMGVFRYNPSNPSDPQEQALKYQLSLVAEPMNSGSFNINNERLAVGSNKSLRAYSYTDFVFRNWTIGDSVLSTNPNIDFVMPSHNVQIIGHFEYCPANPANPNKNYWNNQTREVIVDDFTPGGLHSAISTAISGSSNNDVLTIIVSGKINSNDFNVANNYKNCSLFDLSRVTGITEVPSYAFDYTNLETIYLPYTIEKIGTRAFADCTKLSSIILYAMTPPTLESGVFQGLPEGFVVYVPAAAISHYQDDETWGKFTLLPIQEDIRSITISLPNGTNEKDYAQMWLELTNIKSGQRIHYVMTNQKVYTFANIIRNTSWNVTLRNERGDIFGNIDNVEVKDEDVSVTFASLSKPQNVSLTVLSPDGKDVTNQVQTTWTDALDNYVAQGTSLSGLPVGYDINYRIVLSQDLAMKYNTPPVTKYTLKEGENALVYQLQAIKKITFTGKVKDAATNLPLSGSVISVSQTFSEKYSKTMNAKTDNKGVFTMEIFNVPTFVTVAATNYVSQTLNYSNNEFSKLNDFIVPDVSLKPITGATISVGFTYTTVNGETQNWYNEYENVNYTLYNTTQNKPIKQFNVQYPQIVLLEEVNDSDVLRLTANSRTNAFKAVEATTIIVKQRGEATFAITELGRIEASFSKTDNASVVGSLYDASGKFVKSYNYSDDKLTINNLADGKYTLVSMGNSQFFNTIYNLSQLPQTGLTAGTDYVQNTVNVKSGIVTKIDINEVPMLNENKLYYTNDNTSFTVNKSSIVVGNYLTLTGRIDFKPTYATNVSNVQMIVDLPESCQFVENSVMVGNNTSSYILNDHKITIPMEHYSDRVRFCIIPTFGGEYVPSAFVRFDLNGETITQPIGSANYTAKDLSISVPSTIAKTSVPVSGTAIGTSNVEIYDNGVLIGKTTSLANGTWTTTCELNEPYNLSRHQIHAKVTTKQGIELTSENISCVYDKNSIQVSVVKMYHDNPEMGKTYELTFDFLNPSNKEENYIYYIYNKKFTFTIDFTNNDTTKVSNVILYVKTAKTGWHPLEASYDSIQDKWVAIGEFGNLYDGDLPVNVSVDFDLLSHGPVSRQALSEAKFDYYNYSQEVEVINNEVEKLISSASNLSTDEFEETFTSLFGLSVSSSSTTTNELPLNEILDYADLLIGQSEELLSEENVNNGWKQFLNQTEFGTIDLTPFGIDGSLKTEEIGNITQEELLELGFNKIEMDDNTHVYELVTENKYMIVDFSSNTYKTLSYNYNDKLCQKRRTSNYNLNDIQILIDKKELFESKVSEVVNIASNINAAISAIPDFFNTQILVIDAQIVTNRNTYQTLRQSITKDMSEAQVAKIKEKVEILIQKNCRLGQQKRHLNITLKKLAPVLSKITSVVSALCNAYTLGNNLQEYIDLWFNVPYCECYPERTASLQKSILKAGLICAAKDFANIIGDIILLKTFIGSAPVEPIVSVVSIGVAVGKWWINDWSNKKFSTERKRFSSQSIALGRDKSCNNCPNPEPEPTKPTNPNKPNPQKENGGDHKSNNNDKKFGIDPSGYVYEGVTTNRIEGVTATIYYKEDVEDMYGDLHENVVKWDAEEFAQDNPLFTDENGFYRWDVPQGLWQVKFEKEGYETTYSEWLPVPPPQLDVNIAIKQNVQPTVKLARAYEDAVEIEFNKYMIPELLTTENIIVMQGSKTVKGSVELLNEEGTYEGGNESFASKIRFNAVQPFIEKEITLIVSNRVKSYAGIRMQDNYQQTFTVEQEIKQIVSDSVVIVSYGNSSTLIVSVLPASASKGKKLTVKTSSPIILGVETEQVVIGSDGKAEITVSGKLPGTASLTFSVEGTDQTALTIANVENITSVATPTANIASGTVVEKGTKIELSCATEGATIYYTLDGSCPCENTAASKVYNGPIVINENVTIKAMAIVPNMYESDVAEFVYIVDDMSDIDDVIVDEQIKIYPIPVCDKVNISAGGKIIKGINISSMNGVIVASSNKVATTITLDVSSITAGIYIISVQTDERTYSRKILKAK